MYAYNDNGSMVDVRCEPAEWTNTFRLLTTVKDDVEMQAETGLEDSVVIVLQDSSAEQLDSITSTATAAAAESKRRRWREMPPHMRSCVVDPHDELLSWRRYATNNARQTCKRLGPAKE